MTHKTKIVIIISCILLAISTQIKTFVAHKTRELPPVQSHQIPTNQSTMIHAQGKWTSPQSPAYFAPYSGIIDTCYIKTGDIVTKNAPLITYDTTELTHQIQQTQLNIQAARNNHTQLHKQRYYQKKLRQNHIISKHDYDQYLTNLQGAKIKINQLSHQLNHLKNRVAKHTVKANHNGHITHLFINEGEYVLKGTHLLDVQDPTKLEIKAKINDYDAHKIQLHQTVTITSPAIPKKNKWYDYIHTTPNRIRTPSKQFRYPYQTQYSTNRYLSWRHRNHRYSHSNERTPI